MPMASTVGLTSPSQLNLTEIFVYRIDAPEPQPIYGRSSVTRPGLGRIDGGEEGRDGNVEEPKTNSVGIAEEDPAGHWRLERGTCGPPSPWMRSGTLG